MDLSISLITEGYWRNRGAEAHQCGLGINDHDMTPGSAAIKDWQGGWRQAEYDARQTRLRVEQAAQLAEAAQP